MARAYFRFYKAFTTLAKWKTSVSYCALVLIVKEILTSGANKYSLASVKAKTSLSWSLLLHGHSSKTANLKTNNIEGLRQRKWSHNSLKQAESRQLKTSLPNWICASIFWSETTNCLNCDKSLSSKRIPLFKLTTESSSFCSVFANEMVLTLVHV